jgi:hypothetical protein
VNSFVQNDENEPLAQKKSFAPNIKGCKAQAAVSFKRSPAENTA